MSPELSLTVSHRNGARAVIQVSGVLDLDTTPVLEHALTELINEGAHHLVLDMAAVTFCDSTGINTLIRILARTRQDHAGSLALADTSPQVEHVLDIVGIEAVITTYPDVDLALDSIPAPGTPPDSR